MGKKKIAVLYGGRSSEHEISIITALQAMEAIDPLSYETVPVYVGLDGKWYTGDALYQKNTYSSFDKRSLKEITLLPDPSIGGFLEVKGGKIEVKTPIKIDACFLAFHGQYGEDGCVQGLLELADLPYTGCKVAAASLAMNKTLSKKVAEAEGIPVVPYMQVRRRDAQKNIETVADRIEETFNEYPLFVKPVHLGSSIAISKADNRGALKVALAKTFQFDTDALVEKCITPILEVNVSVIDNDPPVVSVVEIPVSSDGVLSYEDKYLRGGNKAEQTQGMASLQRVIDPIDLNPELKEMVGHYALKLFSSLGAEGVARFDFIVDTDSGKLYFNEVNPIPGSLSYYLWEKTPSRLLYPDIIRQMIDRALMKKQEKESLLPLIGFKALK